MFLFPYRDDNRSYNYPYITIILIFLNTFLFVTPWLSGKLTAMIPVYGFSPTNLIVRPYVIFSSIFMHANLLHLLSNVWFLWLFGDNIEDKYGKFPFLVMYLIAGLIGNLTHVLFTGFQSQVPVIGASGAVAGVMGSYLVRFPGSKVRCVFLLVFYPIFLRIRAFWFLGLWMLFEFFFAFQSPSDNVAHWAHVGGFAFGFSWAVNRRAKNR